MDPHNSKPYCSRVNCIGKERIQLSLCPYSFGCSVIQKYAMLNGDMRMNKTEQDSTPLTGARILVTETNIKQNQMPPTHIYIYTQTAINVMMDCHPKVTAYTQSCTSRQHQRL